MSNLTHVKWDDHGNSRYRGKRKLNGHSWGIDEKAVRTWCDRSDRNHSRHDRDYRNRSPEFERRTVTDGRISRGLFHNAKESCLVINDLPSTTRENMRREVADIVAPSDSVEYVRQPYEHTRRNASRSRREVRGDTDLRKDYHHSYRRYSQEENDRSRRRHYHDHNALRSPYKEYRQPRDHHRDYHHRYNNHRRYSPDRRHEGWWQEQRHYDNYREHGHAGHEYYNHRSRREDYHQRKEKNLKHRHPGLFSTLKRTRTCAASSPQLPSMFAGGYEPVIARPSLESSITNTIVNQNLSRSTLESTRSVYETYRRGSQTGAYPEDLQQVTSEYEATSDSETDEIIIEYPSKRIAERILIAVPRLPLKDDANDRYGATARDLLKLSLKANKERNNQSAMQLEDILNRTTRLSYNTFTQEDRYGDVATENLFHPVSIAQEIYDLGHQPTPEREKEFNRTFVIGDDQFYENYIEGFQRATSSNQETVNNLASNEINSNILLNTWRNNAMNSPGDETFLRGLDQVVDPLPPEFNFDPSSFF